MSKKFAWAALGLVVSLGAVGCSVPASGEPEAIDSAASPINGGYADSTDVNVVGVAQVLQDGSVGLCSGSLLAPNLVLTAHHCVAPVPEGGVDCGSTGFGSVYPIADFFVTTHAQFSMNPADYHTVTEVKLPTDSTLLCGNDMAILILSGNIDASEAVPLIPRVDSEIASGDPYSAAGFGGTDDNGTGAGERRRRDDLMVNCVGSACPFEFQNKPSEWAGFTGVCEGDSGGPAIDADNRVIGVTSRGGQGCVDPIYGDLSAWGQWIKDTTVYAAGLGGYTAPGWATGAPTDPVYSAPVGAACAQPSDCPTDACYDGYCTRPCTDLAPCPDGYECDATDAVCVLPPTMTKNGGGDDGGAVSDDSGCSTSSGDTSGGGIGVVLAAIALAFASRRRKSVR